MAKKFPLKGSGVTGSAGSKYTGLKYKSESPKSGGTSPYEGSMGISSDGQGRASSTLKGSKVFRTKPSGSSGALGGAEKSAGVSGVARNVETNLGKGTVYRNSKPARRK
jgi:hypothetical protein